MFRNLTIENLHSSANVCAAVLRCIRPKKSLETCNVTYLANCIEIDNISLLLVYIYTIIICHRETPKNIDKYNTKDFAVDDDNDDDLFKNCSWLELYYISHYYIFTFFTQLQIIFRTFYFFGFIC